MSDNNIPISEPLPQGIELTEVTDGEKSELMQRALEDKAITEQNGDLENEPEKPWAPTPVWEVPDHALERGEIAQHDGTNESALRISAWLNSKGYSAFVVPAFKDFPAFIRLEVLFNAETIGESDYVFVSADTNDFQVLRASQARLRFRVQNDEAPVGKRSIHL